MRHLRGPNLILFIGACCATGMARSQSVAPSVFAGAGGYFQNGDGSIAWTLGEPVIDTHAAGDFIITQGFHQPDGDFSTAIAPIAMVVASGITLFPNPTRDEVVLLLSSVEAGTTYALFDGLGKLIAKHGVSEERTTIDLSHQANGNYLLHVIGTGAEPLEIFKVTLAK